MAKTYLEIKELIRKHIHEEGLKAGDRLPTGRNLANKLETSYVTADRALRALADEGIVERQGQRGTFVADRTIESNKKKQTIAVVVHSLSSGDTIPNMVDGIQSVIVMAGYHMSLHYTHGSLNTAMTIAEEIFRQKDAGVIYAPPGKREEFNNNIKIFKFFHDRSIPFVVAGHANMAGIGFPISSVASDHYHGARVLTQHLINLGHKRIACLSYPPNGDISLLHKGIKDTLKENGLSLPNHWMRMLESGDSPRTLTKLLLHSPNKPTAIICIDDLKAGPVMAAINESGLRVPEDIAVVGFGDLPICLHLQTPLTTVHVRHYEEGKMLAEILVGLIEGAAQKGTSIELPCDLIVRQSCGASKPSIAMNSLKV